MHKIGRILELMMILVSFNILVVQWMLKTVKANIVIGDGLATCNVSCWLLQKVCTYVTIGCALDHPAASSRS